MAEINSIFDYIFPRKKASDYQQTNLLDYGESPESQNVYNPGQGDFGVMSLEGLKNAIPSTVSGTLDFMYDSAGTLRRPDFKQVQDNVEPGDFNIYNAYAGTDKFQPFTTSFRQTGLLPTKEEEQAFRERSMGYDIGKYGGQFLLGGMGVRSATGKSLGEAMNFAIPGLTLDLEDPNIGDALDALGMDNDFQQFLQGNIDENSTAGERLKQRFTNVLGEFGINVVADTAINTLRVAKNLYKDPEYREQAIKNIGRDMYGDLPGSQLFGGVKSLGGDRSLLEVAKARYKTDGADDFNSVRAYNKRQEIWRDTGWAKGRDGKWYYEMDDSRAQINQNTINKIGNLAQDEEMAFAPKNVLEHPELWKHYPDLDYQGTIRVVPGMLNDEGKIVLKSGASAEATATDIIIPHYQGATAPNIKKTLLHEFQHLIQERERFMQGGNASPGFILKLRDQLYSEMKSKAKEPVAFGHFVNMKRLINAQKYQPQYNEIAQLLEADDVEQALSKLKQTPWWGKEGSTFREKVDYQYKNYLNQNPDATDFEKDDVLRTIKKLVLTGRSEFDKVNKLPPTAMTTVRDSYNKEISALRKQLKEDLNYKTDEELNKYILEQEKTLLGKGFKSHERGLDQVILNLYDPKDKKALNAYTDKFKMIQNVEDGVYNDYNSRYRVYRSLMGEGQSFNVETRMDMTAEKRRELDNFPEETESFGRFTEAIPFDGSLVRKVSDNQPIYLDRPGEFAKKKSTGNFNPAKLIDELEQPRELAPLDEGGYFMKSAQVLLDDPREVYKQPGLLAQVNKKGEVTGELLNKGVTKDEIEETGLLNYLNKKQEAGESVTKQELLDFIQENRPEIAPYVGFRSGDNIVTPNIVIDTPNAYGYNQRTGEFRVPGVENANFKLIKHDDETVFIGQNEEFLEKIITNPSLYGSRALDRRPNVIMRVVDNLEGFTPDQKVEISNSLKINRSNRNLEAVADRMNVPYEDFVENFQNSIEKTAKQDYYRDPQFEWTIPIENDNGVIANYEIRGRFGSEELDQSPYFNISVERDGNWSDLDEVHSLNEARVQIQDSIRSYNYVDDGDTVGMYSGIGTNWSDYVQGNTDLDSYREIAVLMPKYGGSDMDFHSMAGLQSGETKNMLGHLRIDNRYDLQGRKHTHSMEHQSDLSQKAREFGITDEDFDRKLMNAYKAHDKALADEKELRTIKSEGLVEGAKEELRRSPYDSVGNNVRDGQRDALHGFPEFEGLKLDKPLIDQHINRLKKFVIDEGLDDEVGMYMTMDSRGNPQKRILKKESFLKNAIEEEYKDRWVRSLGNDPSKYPTAEEVIERFKNGNPTVMDLKVAHRTAVDITHHFRNKVNKGEANHQKWDLYNEIFGDGEKYIHNGKETDLGDLNAVIRRTIRADSNDAREQAIQKFAKSKGIKGSISDLEEKLNKNVRSTRDRKNTLTNRGKGIGGEQPPLIHKDRHTKVLLKELIKQGIKDGSDVVSWTPSKNQIELWGEGTTSMMRKLYDKDSLEFGNQILKELGLDQKVQTKGATIDYGTMKSYSGETIEQGQRDVMYIELTPELKKAVMNEAPDASDFKATHQAQSDKAFRQPLYAVPAGTAPMFQPPIGLLSTSQTSENDGRIDENKGLLQ